MGLGVEFRREKGGWGKSDRGLRAHLADCGQQMPAWETINGCHGEGVKRQSTKSILSIFGGLIF